MDGMTKRFGYHRPDAATAERHEAFRSACRALAEALMSTIPPGREQSLVLTQIEQAMFWGNAGIARTAAVEREQG